MTSVISINNLIGFLSNVRKMAYRPQKITYIALPVIAKTISIEKSLSSITFNNREDLALRIGQLTNGMSLRDTVYVLKKVANVLLVGNTSLVEKLRLIESQASLRQVLGLITHTMSFDYRILIVKELWDSPCDRREKYIERVFFLSTDMSDKDKIKVITILSQVTSSDKESFLEHYFTVAFKPDIEGDHRIRILTSLKGKNRSDREELIRGYFSLLSPQMNITDKISLLEFLAHDFFSLPSKEAREDLVTQAVLLISDNMNVRDRINIIVALSNRFLKWGPFLVRQTLCLITKDMNATDRILILARLGDARDSDECESLVNQTLLLNENTDLENRLSVLFYLSSGILPQDRQSFLGEIFLLINDVPDAEERLRILHFLNESVPLKEIQSFVTEALPIITHERAPEDRLDILIALNARRPKASDNEEQIYDAISSSPIEIPRQYGNYQEWVRDSIEGDLYAIFYKKHEIKEQFIINSHKVIKNPIEVVIDLYESLQNNALKFLPSINYIDSEGVDMGGVNRSFITTLMESLCDPKYSLVTGSVSNVVPIMGMADNTSSLSLEVQEKCFAIIGRFFSEAVQGYTVIGQHFDPIVFEMLFHLSAKEVAGKDSSEVFDKMLKIYILKKLNATEEMAENLVQNNITEELREVYYIESKDQFIQENELDKKFKAILIIAESLYSSLFLKTRWAGTSAAVLQEKIQGVVSRDIVQKAFVLDFRSKASQISIEYLNKWVAEANFQTLQKFIEAISGTRALTPSTQLAIGDIEGIDKFPVFHTCALSIDISQYSSYEAFKEKLEISLEHCFFEGGFQMP